MKQAYVYILGNNCLTLYIGVTSDLIKRVYLRKQKIVSGFSSKYKLYKLLYYEVFTEIKEVIRGEKQLKNWHREWKLNLIRSKNPSFKDLYSEIL